MRRNALESARPTANALRLVVERSVDPNILCQNLKSLGVNEMSEPRFSVGQKVRYSPSVTQDRQSGAGFFEIIRSMPDERVGHSYRIRHVSDGHERIAREHQLNEEV